MQPENGLVLPVPQCDTAVQSFQRLWQSYILLQLVEFMTKDLLLDKAHGPHRPQHGIRFSQSADKPACVG